MGTEQQQDDMLPLRQAAEGDEAAFAVIVRRMAPVTRTLTARYAAPGLEREDLSQECMPVSYTHLTLPTSHQV